MVVECRTLHFQFRDCRLDPRSGTKIPHVIWYGQNINVFFLKTSAQVLELVIIIVANT